MTHVIVVADESTLSSLSSDSDSCEYYQTEIFDQLPSIQATLFRQNTQPISEGGPEPGGDIGHGLLSRRPKDKESTQPIRNLAMCIQGKRDARWEKICFVCFCVILTDSLMRPPTAQYIRSTSKI